MLELVQADPTRRAAYGELFGGEAVRVYPWSDFTRPDDAIRIEVLVYPLREPGQNHVVMVTSGYSELGQPRRELIQYLPHGRRADAHRLHSAAYAAAVAGRELDFGSTMTLPYPSGSAWPHTILLPPPVSAHSEFSMEMEGGPVRLLWHVPLSESEFAYQAEYGIGPLLRGMSSAELPWFFDEATRPVLVGRPSPED